jgi:hypothetical protein
VPRVNDDDQRGDAGYLSVLFERVKLFTVTGAIRPFHHPDPRSSLAADDAPLGSWNANTLIGSSITAGVVHVDALQRLVVDLGIMDGFTPWTLLRASLEDFAVAAWLLFGDTRRERRRRALVLWAEDMRNRGQYEDDSGHVSTGPQERSGRERQEQIRQLADNLEIPRASLQKPETGAVIVSVAEAVGLDGVGARATWRIASGFAHGRYWPNLRAATPSAACPMPGGALVGLTIDRRKHNDLAVLCDRLLAAVVERHELRASQL